MHADDATRNERVVRAWLKTVPVAERTAALARAAERHGLRRRAAESNAASRNRGTWYTPDGLVKCVLDTALDARIVRRGVVCDPACGAGNFLVEVARRMLTARRAPAAIARAVHGCDIDATAVALTRVRLWHAVGGTPQAWRASIRCGDSLAGGDASMWGTGARAVQFDAVVGNPPFINQTRCGSAATRREAAALRERFGGAISGYADIACAFVLLGVELVAAGGRVAYVLPMSLLAAADAGPARQVVERTCRVLACHVPPARVFGAGGVSTVVLALGKGARAPRGGVPVRPVLQHRQSAPGGGGEVRVPGYKLAGGAWGALLAAVRGVPPLPPGLSVQGTLRDIAIATADFRQHYYGLRGRVLEWPAYGATAGSQPLNGMPDPGVVHRAAIVTVGSVDPAQCAWGVRSVRLLGKAYQRPVADLRALARVPELSAWLQQRLVPKLLVATQTRVLEAWVDAHGVALPSTPLITVVPTRAAGIWAAASVLLSPVASAFCWWRHAGAALSPTALKISARQVLDIPLPANRAAWERAARHVRAWHAEPTCDTHALACAQAMNDAYGVDSRTVGPGLVAWWSAARPAPR